MQLRDYQIKLKNDAFDGWRDGHRNVMLVSPTRSGKTVTMASIANDLAPQPGVVIAHRVEIVGQISTTFARFGIRHNVIGPSSTVKYCIQKHIRDVGRSHVDRRAVVTVAAVDTLVARSSKLGQWPADQRWWMIDEAHHVLADNKWGKAVNLFGNGWGLGVTATPLRADRRSLHVDQGGVFSHMVIGPSMRELINRGSICEYRIFAPKNSIDVSAVPVGSTGDYSQPKLREAAHKSMIVGDIVESYLKIAPGKRGITFTVDVEQAIEVAEAFNRAGVPAMAVHAQTDATIRDDAVRKLATGKLLQLVNVDLFGEGFDVPVVEVVSMGRPTMSYGLFVQQFARALTPFEGKTHGIIIDHVSNVKRHGLPDAPRTWTLRAEERGKRLPKDPDEIAVKRCVECFNDYRAVSKMCPFCGHVHEPAGRDRPEQVDGDLVELDPQVLAQMRDDAARAAHVIDTRKLTGLSRIKAENHNITASAQVDLRDAIARWAWVWHSRGAADSEIYRRFFHLFGTDVMTAQTLGATDARELTERVRNATVCSD
jgi:superfamily II DNA or RNA helicase